MTEKQIKALFQCGHFPNSEIMHQLIETHISWVLLGEENVYKIKKPLQLSFLDFSTLEKRKIYCKRELNLNTRLAPDMYLDVITVCSVNAILSIGGQEGVIDYALRMKRMDNRREMRKLLTEDKVDKHHIKLLAEQISDFHRQAEIVYGEVNKDDLKNDFNDILQIEDFVSKILGFEKAGLLRDMVEISNHFIETHFRAMEKRSKDGFVRDCHGDLHSGNIFLTSPPVIFDCIEFNDHFRHIDVLNEVAFFCMDLDFFGKENFALYFMEEYKRNMGVTFGQFERNLFLYYKFYRANVKTKVNAIKYLQESVHDTKDRGLLFKQYFSLMEYYYQQLKPDSL